MKDMFYCAAYFWCSQIFLKGLKIITCAQMRLEVNFHKARTKMRLNKYYLCSLKHTTVRGPNKQTSHLKSVFLNSSTYTTFSM